MKAVGIILSMLHILDGKHKSTNVDQHIKYAKMGGFRLMNIYYPVLKEEEDTVSLEVMKLTRRYIPMEKKIFRKCWIRLKRKVSFGCSFSSFTCRRKSQYVTPVPDYRLNLVKTFNLSENLGRDDTTVYVEQNPEGSVMAEGCRVLKVGTELISYENFTTVPPYKFTGCKRAIDNTTVNSLPKGYSIGILDVSTCYHSLYKQENQLTR